MKINKYALPLNQINGHARQGDTLLRRRAAAIPSSLKSTKTPILALGEKTGHFHAFRDGGAVGFADDENAATVDFVRVTAREAALTHEEHSPIVFPAGDYESLKQVEDTGAEVVRVRD